MEFAIAVCLGLVYTTVVVYRVDAAGLNPLQLILVGTALEAAYFAFQLPTGVLADTSSRRACVVAGVAVLGLGFVMEGLLPLFVGILLAQVVRALGLSLVTGAQEAWAASELGTEGLAKVYLRGSQAGLVGTLCGTAVSALIASVGLNLPLIVGGIALVVLAVLLALSMPENNFTPAPQTGFGLSLRLVWTSFSATTKSTWGLIRVHPAFLLVFGVVAFLGSWHEGLDRLWGAHLLEDYRLPTVGGLSPVTWFSLISVAATLLGLLATHLVGSRVDDAESRSTMRLMLGVVLVLLVSTVVFGLATNFAVTIAMYLVAAAFRAAYGPLLSAWLARQTDESLRATVLSAKDMFDSVGQFVGGPVIGLVGTLMTLRAAMVAAAAALAPASLLLGLALRRLHPVPIEAPDSQPAQPSEVKP
jgi:DHA3 family tetracycline resistance protein-like MFS transporter